MAKHDNDPTSINDLERRIFHLKFLGELAAKEAERVKKDTAAAEAKQRLDVAYQDTLSEQLMAAYKDGSLEMVDFIRLWGDLTGNNTSGIVKNIARIAPGVTILDEWYNFRPLISDGTIKVNASKHDFQVYTKDRSDKDRIHIHNDTLVGKDAALERLEELYDMLGHEDPEPSRAMIFYKIRGLEHGMTKASIDISPELRAVLHQKITGAAELIAADSIKYEDSIHVLCHDAGINQDASSIETYLLAPWVTSNEWCLEKIGATLDIVKNGENSQYTKERYDKLTKSDHIKLKSQAILRAIERREQLLAAPKATRATDV